MVYSAYWTVPFVGTLLSVAALPVLAPAFWHKNSGKVFLFWSLLICAALGMSHSLPEFTTIVSDTMLSKFLPFIILIAALYIITGGIYFTVFSKVTATVNVVIVGIGALSASWIGTTGAAMVMIRPLLRLNAERKYNTHLVIFFIFLVANIGGGVTPIGDPPLFVGFLSGVDFFWSLRHLSSAVYPVIFGMLGALYLVDSYLLKKEGCQFEHAGKTQIAVKGKRNILLLVVAVSSVMLSGVINIGAVEIFGITLPIASLIRDLILLILSAVSLATTPKDIRRHNDFSFGPLKEVAELFVAIFLTLIPVEHILHMGADGPFGPLFAWLSQGGELSASKCFWLTGALSSVLDNAPTYLTFFHLAGGDPNYFMNAGAHVLKAVSLGSVFFGALTYIGNAPNFMIKSIAQSYGYEMPSFFGYIKWSCAILLPIFALVSVMIFQ
ncbi:MAG: sodium:proton antiporter [Holosporales bacterium]|jgi:Na+/H+ antiporter NhaD/arsenite permease-like protein|nr:sodium:proton antiporter [Holosporales bacterium]